MSCPPCKGDCQQGRECPHRWRREPSIDDIAVLVLAVAAAVAAVVIALVIL